jgi:hypothetical protein
MTVTPFDTSAVGTPAEADAFLSSILDAATEHSVVAVDCLASASGLVS